MTPERWREVARILDRILDADPADQTRLLAELGGEDAVLQADVEALLAAERAAGDLLERPAGDCLESDGASLDASSEVPDLVGPWRPLSVLGRGGMGVVYLAERADGEFDQRVALKLVKRGVDTDEILERFRRERQILAALDHPQIARLVDGGVTAGGLPYFAMELVEGQPITTWCDERGLGLEARLRLFQQVCNAVSHAHRRLVVHRDLKPTNVLVGADGAVKLLDFGIAKLLAGADAPDAPRTRDGLRLMTPEYAAPEQVRGEPVSTATDVYGLGALLYDLLTGERPHELAGRSLREIEETVGREPRAPSLVSRHPFARRLTGDLEAITLTALRAEPGRRYASAQALADDVQRHLERRPVQARPERWTYRAGRFVERHRLGVAATAAIAASLVGGLGAALWQARQKALEADKARAVQAFVTELFSAAAPAQARGETVTARQLLDLGAGRIGDELGGQPAIRAEMEVVLGELYAELGLFDEALPLLDRAETSQLEAGGDARALVARARRGQSAVLLARGELDDAEARIRDALALHRETLGSTDPEVAEDLDRLAMVLRQRGDLDGLEAAVRESLAIRRAAFGERHEKVADSLNNLAVVLRERTDYTGAEEHYRRALDIRLAELGRRHPDTADTLNNLAALLYFQGRWGEAHERFVEVTGLYRDLYGDGHPLTVQGLNNTAVIRLFLGRFDEAREGFEQVLAHWAASGDDHPNAIVTRGNLGLLLQRSGRLAEAERVLREVRDAWRAKLGGEHPYNAVLDGRLAAVLRERGQFDAADALHRQALEGHKRAYGDAHPNVAQELEGLGRLARVQGRLDLAETALGEAAAIRAAVLDELHPDRWTVEAEIAAVAGDAGRIAEAIEGLEAALDRAAEALPNSHPRVLWVRMELGRALDASGRSREAIDHLAAAASGFRASFGSRSWRAAEADTLLASALAAEGRSAEARSTGARAHKVLVAELGPEHPLTDRAAAVLRQLED